MVKMLALNGYNTISVGNNTAIYSWEGKGATGVYWFLLEGSAPDLSNAAGLHIIEGRDFYRCSSRRQQYYHYRIIGKMMSKRCWW